MFAKKSSRLSLNSRNISVRIVQNGLSFVRFVQKHLVALVNWKFIIGYIPGNYRIGVIFAINCLINVVIYKLIKSAI